MLEKTPPMIGVSLPIEGEAGQTGTWRSKRPVIDPKRCLTCREKPRDCRLCWLYCPDAAITQARPPAVDYRYCKGCGVCAKECPTRAIDMVPEVQR